MIQIDIAGCLEFMYHPLSYCAGSIISYVEKYIVLSTVKKHRQQVYVLYVRIGQAVIFVSKLIDSLSIIPISPKPVFADTLQKTNNPISINFFFSFCLHTRFFLFPLIKSGALTLMLPNIFLYECPVYPLPVSVLYSFY